MPIIKVWCLPKLPEEKLREIFQAMISAVESIEALGLKAGNSVTVLFPTDMMSYGIGEEIIIEVSGLFKKAERTFSVRNQLAYNLGTAIQEFFPDALIECFIQSFNMDQGFWSSRQEPLPKDFEGICARSIEELSLGTRGYNALKNAEINRLRTIFFRTEEMLSNIRHFGPVEMSELKSALYSIHPALRVGMLLKK
ncbi:MAG: DNA-directed RNA polymerase subunit alpha C-terminal domain-containing protein [bacterium]